MDNFGIFKLLSSFYSAFSKQNQSENLGENAIGTETDTATADNGNGNFSIKSNEKEALQKNPTQNSLTEKPTLGTIPLQSKMLNTMKSHDDFVKRVKNSNKK